MRTRDTILVSLFLFTVLLGGLITFDETSRGLVTGFPWVDVQDYLTSRLWGWLSESIVSLISKIVAFWHTPNATKDLLFFGGITVFGTAILGLVLRTATKSPHDKIESLLKALVEEKERAENLVQLKSEFLNQVSHELRTPLTSINGFAELLTADDQLPEQAKEFVTIIANEAQRLSRMINTFLAVTQLQRKDKQEVQKIPLRLDEVVRETIMSLQPIAKKRRIRLVDQPTQRLPPVAADKSLISQAVRNLVSNAIKYSPERTTVTVSTALEAEAVRVSVEDRGYGIPDEAKDRVWEKFYRVVREGQEKDEESTGLGLSFVRQVVEQHGGTVDLDSQVGRGSKFSFTLPRL